LESKRRARWVGALIVAAAIVIALVTFWQTNIHPRTDDAAVFANLIGIAPEVEGPVVKLHVKDNQFVKAGDVLFEIEPEPYEYALQRALSEQQALEKQIYNENRVIAGQEAAIEAAQANVFTSEAHVSSAEANINSARASIAHAEAGLSRAEADHKFATDTFHRLEPLLAKQFVTVEDVDRARTGQQTAAEEVRQARSQLDVAKAQLEAALAQRNQAGSTLQQSHAQLAQSQKSVTTVLPLIAQREARAAAVRQARYNLSRCRVVAPFDARVTDLTISEGAYAHIGQRVFTLIDVRNWWVIGNFRESQLKYIRPGMAADIYVMSRPNRRFSGTIDSIGFGVTPQESALGGALPQVQRTLAWVHLATRFPVRVRVNQPAPDLFRIGESGFIIVRGEERPRR
jgi:multidrug efflux system membrane fusion protein